MFTVKDINLSCNFSKKNPIRNPQNKDFGDFLWKQPTIKIVERLVIKIYSTRFVVDSKFKIYNCNK